MTPVYISLYCQFLYTTKSTASLFFGVYIILLLFLHGCILACGPKVFIDPFMCNCALLIQFFLSFFFIHFDTNGSGTVKVKTLMCVSVLDTQIVVKVLYTEYFVCNTLILRMYILRICVSSCVKLCSNLSIYAKRPSLEIDTIHYYPMSTRSKLIISNQLCIGLSCMHELYDDKSNIVARVAQSILFFRVFQQGELKILNSSRHNWSSICGQTLRSSLRSTDKI